MLLTGGEESDVLYCCLDGSAHPREDELCLDSNGTLTKQKTEGRGRMEALAVKDNTQRSKCTKQWALC